MLFPTIIMAVLAIILYTIAYVRDEGQHITGMKSAFRITIETLPLIIFAFIVAGLVQIAMQIPPLRASGVTIRPAWDIHSEPFRKVFFLMAPMIIGLTATQLNTLADTWIAMFFSGSVVKGDFFTLLGAQINYPLWDGAVSHLYFSQRIIYYSYR